MLKGRVQKFSSKNAECPIRKQLQMLLSELCTLKCMTYVFRCHILILKSIGRQNFVQVTYKYSCLQGFFWFKANQFHKTKVCENKPLGFFKNTNQLSCSCLVSKILKNDMPEPKSAYTEHSTNHSCYLNAYQYVRFWKSISRAML